MKKEITIPCMNDGTGMMTAKMFVDNGGKIIPCTIHKGGSIGTHCHETSYDINYVLSGEGKAICDGIEEFLMGAVARNALKGYVYQQYIFTLFLAKMDTERSISKIESEAIGTAKFDDLYIVDSGEEYRIQIKNYKDTTLSDIEVVSCYKEVQRYAKY